MTEDEESAEDERSAEGEESTEDEGLAEGEGLAEDEELAEDEGSAEDEGLAEDEVDVEVDSKGSATTSKVEFKSVSFVAAFFNLFIIVKVDGGISTPINLEGDLLIGGGLFGLVFGVDEFEGCVKCIS